VSNTTIASAVSVIVWTMLSLLYRKRVDPIAVLNGAIAGLAGITPASGFIQTYFAGIVGFFCGVTSWYGIVLFKKKMKYDDALDVSSIHGLTGIVGSLSIGFFADKSINPEFGNDGLLNGNAKQLSLQALGVGVAMVWSCFWTWIILLILRWFMPLKVSEEEENIGLDLVEHGVSAYTSEFNVTLSSFDAEKRPINIEEYEHYEVTHEQ